MTLRKLFVSLTIFICLVGSGVAAYRSNSFRASIESAIGSVPAESSGRLATVHATAGPRLSLRAVTAVSDFASRRDLSIDGMQATAAAAADFDEDGTPDLVAAYGNGSEGVLAIWRGNVDARYPNTPEARARQADGTFSEAPFLGILSSQTIGSQPQFIAASDFDGDGHIDVVVAGAGSATLHLLAGDGAGSLAPSRSIELPGAVSAFASGDLGQLDGHADVVVSFTSEHGSALAILHAGSPEFGKSPETIPTPAVATSVAIGRIGDDGPPDVVAAAGQLLWMHNGVAPDSVDRRSLEGRVLERRFDFGIQSVVIGNFAGSKRRDLSILDTEGGIHVLAQLGARDLKVEAASLPPLESLSSASLWDLIDGIREPQPAPSAHPLLARAKLSEGDFDDLVVSDGPDSVAVLVNGAASAAQKARPAFEPVVESISAPFEATAALPLRLNGDALSDLALFGAGSSQPSTIVSAPRLTFTVTNTADSGAGSLRQAILDANMAAGFDSINFAIPGGAPHVINLVTELPQVTGTCSIDATTNPSFAGTPVVRIHGAGIAGSANGLTLVGGSTLIRGFSITGFPGSVLTGSGIFFPNGSGDGNTIEGNFIGVDTGGVTVIANGSDGVRGEAGSDNHTIGGTVAAARNVSAANSDGVQLSNTIGAMIQGNFLGPNSTGMSGPGNVASGCRLIGTTGCTVGGSAPGSRNVISGNAMEGVVANTGATGNTISGNFIGMDVTGNSPLPNGGVGVNLSGANSTTLGGPTVPERNVIAANNGGGVSAPAQSHNIQGNYIGLSASGTTGYGNGANGVIVGGNNSSVSGNEVVQHSTVGINASGLNISIAGNNIYGNNTCVIASAAGITMTMNFVGQSPAGVNITADVICTDNNFVQITQPIVVTGAASSDLRRNRFLACGAPAIDLNADGPTANDPGDGDAGPNGLQNFPVITSAVAVPGATAISGTLNSNVSQNYEIVYYSNPACNAGEAQTFLGSQMVATDGAGNAMFNFNAPAVAPGAVIIATATRVSTPTPATSELSACATVMSVADISATIADAPDPVVAGGNLTYTITVSNAGPSSATGLTFTQTTPASTTFVSIAPSGGWMCTTPPMGGSGPITCTAPSMGPMSSAFFSVTLAVPPSAGGTMLNSSVTASSSVSDPVPGNNTQGAVTSVIAQADMQIVAMDTPDPVTAGTALTIGATVTNAGPSDSQMVTVNQAVPAGTTFASHSAPPGWSCSTPPIGGSGTVTCTNPSVVAGNIAVFSLVVDVPASTPDGSMLSSTSTVASMTPDPTPANDSSMTLTTVDAQADLSISLVGAPDPVVAGTSLSYAINILNGGPSDAQSVSVAISTPAATTFASVSSPPGWNCTSPPVGGTGAVTCTAPTLANGAGASFSITVDVSPAAPDGSNIPATATVASASTDPNGANDSAGDSTTVAVAADCSIGMMASPNPVIAGTQLAYFINVINGGPSDALSAVVSTATPAGTNLASIAAAPGWNCTGPAPGASGAVTCTSPLLGAGATASFVLTVNVLPGVADGSTIDASATVASATADPAAANNTSATSTLVSTSANLGLASVAEPETVNAGEIVTYTITATNLGPSDALDVTINTVVPEGLSFDSATADGGTCTVPAVGATEGNVVCTWPGPTPVGGMRTAIVTLRALTDLPDGTLVTGGSTVSSSTLDADTTNNVVSDSVSVIRIADLSLAIANVPDPVGPGSTLVSTMTVTNNGPVAASGVEIQTATPEGTVFSSIQTTQGTATTPAVGESGPIVISLGDMPNGATAVVTLACVVTASDGASVTASASLTTLTNDPDPENNAVSAQSMVAVGALQSDVSASVTLDPPEVVTGTEAIIDINVANAGPDPAADVVVSHTIPPGATLRSVTASQGTVTAPAPGSGGTVRVQVGSMVAGADANIRIVVQVSAPTGSLLLVSAIASSSSSDPEPFNNSSIGELGVREGEAVMLEWLPPDFNEPVDFPPPRSLTISRTRKGKAPRRIVDLTRLVAGPRSPRATLVGYNIYRSNQPGTAPIPGNLFTQVPAGTTAVTSPTSPGGSFFVVTAQYDSGESGPTNEASGNIPAAELSKVNVKNTKIVATGTGFSEQVQVFVDGIPFVNPAKVKKEATKVVQKGNLITGQTIGQYVASRGGVVVISFRNSNGGIATYRLGE